MGPNYKTSVFKRNYAPNGKPVVVTRVYISVLQDFLFRSDLRLFSCRSPIFRFCTQFQYGSYKSYHSAAQGFDH